GHVLNDDGGLAWQVLTQVACKGTRVDIVRCARRKSDNHGHLLGVCGGADEGRCCQNDGRYHFLHANLVGCPTSYPAFWQVLKPCRISDLHLSAFVSARR